MKRIVSLLLAALLTASLCACQLPQAPDSGEKEEWESFIQEYNEFVDEYIQLFKKYKDDPTDMSILEDFTEAATKAAEWSSKAAEITKKLIGSPEDAAAFAAELAEIAKKLVGITP